jgi:prepilin-type processing-associated H-X9-DG protein
LAQFITDYHVYPSDPLVKEYQWTSWFEALESEGLSASKNSRFYEAGVWYCPSAPRPSGFPAQLLHGSYGYNSYGMAAMRPEVWLPGKAAGLLGLGGYGKTSSNNSDLPVRETDVAQSSRMLAIGESVSGSGVFIPVYGHQSYSRHQGKVNVLFCDGHVESPSVQVLFMDTSDTALSRWNRDNQPHRDCLAP